MKLVPNSVSTKFARQILVGKKHSPETLLAAGIVGVGATIVLACRATLQVEDILTEHEKQSQHITETLANDVYPKYDDGAARSDRAKLFVQTGVEFGKVYGPAVVVGAMSISALVGSHNILSKRNAALAAAYGTLEKAYAEYRDRVRAEVGKDREEDLYLDMRPCEIDDPEDARKKLKGKRSFGGSPYAKLFDEYNINYNPVSEFNMTFLRLQENVANQRLQAKGHVFLNEIYDVLGLERTPAGQIVGWVKGQGNDYITFGIFNRDSESQLLEFISGREKSIWLDFNVDGNIYEKI